MATKPVVLPIAGCCRTAIGFSPLHLIQLLRHDTNSYTPLSPCASLVQISLIPLSAEEVAPSSSSVVASVDVQRLLSCSSVELFMDISFPIVNYSARSFKRSMDSAITAFDGVLTAPCGGNDMIQNKRENYRTARDPGRSLESKHY